MDVDVELRSSKFLGCRDQFCNIFYVYVKGFEVRNPLLFITSCRRKYYRDTLILWDAKRIPFYKLEEVQRRQIIFVVEFYRGHLKIRPVLKYCRRKLCQDIENVEQNDCIVEELRRPKTS